jgi:hypothetical protein
MSRTKKGVIAIILAMFVVAAFFTATAKASFWKNMVTSGPTVPSKEFKVDASGWDLRGYVFKLPGSTKTCVFVAGSKKGGLSCFED